MPILGCQILPWPEKPDWGFQRAYFGNLTLGREVLRRDKATHVVSGDTHKRYDGRLDLGCGREIEVHVVGRAAGKPGRVALTMQAREGG